VTLVIGLGNPGYYGTRHNIGSNILKIILGNIKDGEIIKKNSIIFGVSLSLMNISGLSIKKIYKKFYCKKLIIIVDDIDLKFGVVKCSFGGSARGHNGVKSIIENLGFNFWRIRIGVDRPKCKEEVPNYVLSKFSQSEIEKFPEIVEKVKTAITEVLEKSETFA